MTSRDYLHTTYFSLFSSLPFFPPLHCCSISAVVAAAATSILIIFRFPAYLRKAFYFYLPANNMEYCTLLLAPDKFVKNVKESELLIDLMFQNDIA